MNTQLQRIDDRKRLRFEADLAARLDVLFRHCPALYGFTIDEHSVLPSNVTLHVMDVGNAQAILGEVAELLVEVLEEEPEAIALLQGRTFARHLH
jgi:hypothetical protein